LFALRDGATDTTVRKYCKSLGRRRKSTCHSYMERLQEPRTGRSFRLTSLLFCISMTVFGLFFEGKITFTALRNLTRTTSVGTLLRVLSVGTIYFGLSIFSTWAGIWLWSEDRRGLSMAKAYLLVAPVIVISLYGILALSGLTVNLPIIVFQRLIYSAIWYACLTRSKRVRDTFFRPA